MSAREFNRIRQRIRDAMICLYSFDREATYAESVTRPDNMTLTAQIILFELVFYHAQSQRRSIYRNTHFLKKIRDSANMILMSMSNYQALYLFNIFLEISEIRYYDVYSEHLVLRESKTAVNNEYFIIALNKCAVFSYFLHSAQRNYPERRPDLFRPPYSLRRSAS